MSRSPKLVAPMVVLAVVAAFIAGLLIGNSGKGDTRPAAGSSGAAHVPNFGQTLALIENDGVRSVTLNQQHETLYVVMSNGQHYITAYPNGYVSMLVRDVVKHEGPAALSVQRSS